MSTYLDNFNNCIEGSIPYCAGACPFNMEILNFIEKARRGSSKAAFNVYRNAVGYPRIVSQVCPGRCRDVCPRKDHGGSINIPELEKASIKLARNTTPTDYNIPAKKERIAIIGAGAGGMCALLRLSTKKYHVEVFEKTDKLGGWLRHAVDPEIVDAEFDEQLQFQDYVLHLNTEITSIDDLRNRNFDAVVVATGDNGNDFGLLNAVSDKGDNYCCEYNGTGWFAIGGLIGNELIDTMAGGLYMGTTVDNYLKTGHQYYPDGNSQTSLCEGMVTLTSHEESITPENVIYTKEEFAAEASRCIECKCSYCIEHCDLCEYSHKWPQRIKDEVVATTLEGKTELKATPARRLMSLCNQCGLCKEVCPESIDMDTLFMVGRQKMFRQRKMPWAFHDFYRRDMDQACGEASLVKGSFGCRYVFFPGCQLGAAEPELTADVYKKLTELYPDTGIMLQCCGIAAEWEGDINSFKEVLDDIRNKWKTLGKPTMILACMTCYKKFREYLPEIPLTTVYELLDAPANQHTGDYSIFNPCSARHEDNTRNAVHKLASDLGVTLHPLAENEQYAKCCGYGGHGDIADKGYSNFVADKRISESPYPYITYCINCRDIFLNHGKEAVHILQLLFGKDTKPLPTMTKRWQNRLMLKEMLSGETMEIKDNMNGITLVINDEIRNKLSSKHIFEHDIAEVIEFCHRTGRTILNTETSTLTGYKVVGNMIYWVEYKILGEKHFELINAYSHRMKIELEAVWNGIRATDE